MRRIPDILGRAALYSRAVMTGADECEMNGVRSEAVTTSKRIENVLDVLYWHIHRPATGFTYQVVMVSVLNQVHNPRAVPQVDMMQPAEAFEHIESPVDR